MISSNIIIAQNTIKLQCIAHGQPTPKLYWYKDGVLLQGENITYSGPRDALLDITIKNPNCTNLGKYVCKAENEHGTLVDAEKPVTAEGNWGSNYMFHNFSAIKFASFRYRVTGYRQWSS